MRVLAVNQFYLPDISATSQLLGELCEDLVAAGHEVDVLASQGTYLGGQRLPRREEINGVRVLRPWATSLGKTTRMHRMADYSTFWATALETALTSRRPDVILSLTTPPMIALGMAGVARLRGVPIVTWVQDVYPELASAFGVLSESSVAYRTLLAASTATHRLTTRAVALSQGMADRLVSQGAKRAALRVIPNWADGRLIRPLPRDENPFRRTHGLQDRFVVMYSGNLGMGHDIETPLQAARILQRSSSNIAFVFVGDGSRRSEAERLARGMDNVRFLPYQPRENLSISLTAADIHLVSLREGLEGLLVPSKLYGALASGRPVFYVGPERCEVASVIRAGGLGWQGRNHRGDELATAISALAADAEHWNRTAGRARETFERQYDRPVCVARWIETLGEACA